MPVAKTLYAAQVVKVGDHALKGHGQDNAGIERACIKQSCKGGRLVQGDVGVLECIRVGHQVARHHSPVLTLEVARDGCRACEGVAQGQRALGCTDGTVPSQCFVYEIEQVFFTAQITHRLDPRLLAQATLMCADFANVLSTNLDVRARVLPILGSRWLICYT